MAVDNSNISVTIGFECKPSTSVHQNVHNSCSQDDFSVDYTNKHISQTSDGGFKIMESDRKDGLWTETEETEFANDMPKKDKEKMRKTQNVSETDISTDELHDGHHLEKSTSEPDRSRGGNSTEDSQSEDMATSDCPDAMETDSSDGSCGGRLEPDSDSEEVFMSVGLGCHIPGEGAELKKQEVGNLSNIDEEEELESFQEEVQSPGLVPETDCRVLSAVSDMTAGRRAIPNTPASFVEDCSCEKRNLSSR